MPFWPNPLQKYRTVLLLALAVLVVMAASAIAIYSYTERDPPRPVVEAPLIQRSVTNLEDATLTHPLLPAFRLSNDGRIGLHIDLSLYYAENGFPVGDPDNKSLMTVTAEVTRAELMADGTVVLYFENRWAKTLFSAGTQVVVKNVSGLGVNVNGKFTAIDNGDSEAEPTTNRLHYKLAAGKYQAARNDALTHASVTGVDGLVARGYINLLKPEAYAAADSEYFHESSDKVKILRSNPDDPDSPITTVSKIWVDGVEKDFDVPDILRKNPRGESVSQVTLCEKPDKPNPYACSVRGVKITDGGKQDCYDLYVVTSQRTQLPIIDTEGKKVRSHKMLSAKITVAVNHPKTAQAEIDKIIFHKDSFTKGNGFQSRRLLEPMVTADGRLIVFRIASMDYWLGDVDGDGRWYEWEDNGEKFNAADDKDGDGKLDREYGYYNTVYSYNDDKEPCDASGWSKTYPIAYAHRDPRLKNSDGSYKYGFAEYPFVSSEGEAITNAKDGVYIAKNPTVCIPAAGEEGCVAPLDIKGNYPWIDKFGNNLFLKVIAESLHYKVWDKNVKILKNCKDGSKGYPHDGKMELGECRQPRYPLISAHDDGVCTEFGCMAKYKTRYPATHLAGYENDRGVICKRDAVGFEFKVKQRWISVDGGEPQKEYLCADKVGSDKWWVREGEAWSGNEQSDNTRGIAVAGRWTKGKIVLLDNLISNTDYGIGVANSQHRLVDLYKDSDKVRIGSGRDVSASNITNSNDSTSINNPLPFDYPRSTDKTHPLGVIETIIVIDSIENAFNYIEKLRPVTPADVVWKVSLGAVTDEVVFDDYLNNNGLIVSNMMAAARYGYSPENDPNKNFRYLQRYPRLLQQYTDYQDGWDGIYQDEQDYTNLYSYLPDRKINERYKPRGIRLQNAASSTYLTVPANAAVIGSVARIEPIAAGGVHGRGFWLNGDNGIQYTMADNRAQNIRQWYVSLFVDNRSAAGERTLVSFPDGSALALKDQNQIIYYSRRGLKTVPVSHIPVAIPKPGWMHIGLQMDSDTNTVSLYIDGYLKDVYVTPTAMFRVDGAGELVVGATASGFRGWIDDFKIFAEKINPEVACNHANGTLMGIDTASAAHWQARAATYPAFSHAAISKVLQSHHSAAYTQYACYHDYSGDYKAHLGNIPVNAKGETASIRDLLLKPEAQLFYDAPRPDFSHNSFCQSCHTSAVKGNPLSHDALAFYPGTEAKTDRRRQPMQPPQRVYGVLPADHWLHANFGGADKSYIDEWLMDAKAR